jgi:Reverse transcriptase (RNA-dependent DNA polymerase)
MRTDEAEAYASTASTGKGGRNLPGTGAGAEVRTAAVGRTKPGVLRLMEAAVERSNMLCAYERVVKNKGAPGVDGLTVAAFKPWLQAHWPRVRQVLLAGEYMPAAVRKVEIPKPQGGVRTLGIPTVLDRMIQQALHQVMQPLFEPGFCESSYGFRPGRSAHQAVKAARGYVAEGRRWTVDLDLEKFFDLVNHDVLMARVARKVKDERVLKLIRRYLEAGLMEGGVVSARTEGTPQGGPFTPLTQKVISNLNGFCRAGGPFVRRLTCAVRGNMFMTYDAIDPSGQGSAVECRSRHAPGQCFAARCHASPIAGVRPIRASGIPIPRRSAKARPTGRSLRGYGANDAQAPSEYGASFASVCENQWADYRSYRDTRVRRVSADSEKAWLSRAPDTARFKFTLTMCLIACTIRSSPRPTVFWCRFGSVPSAEV